MPIDDFCEIISNIFNYDDWEPFSCFCCNIHLGWSSQVYLFSRVLVRINEVIYCYDDRCSNTDTVTRFATCLSSAQLTTWVRIQETEGKRIGLPCKMLIKIFIILSVEKLTYILFNEMYQSYKSLWNTISRSRRVTCDWPPKSDRKQLFYGETCE